MAKHVISGFTTSTDAECPTCAQKGHKTAKVCRVHRWCSQRWFDALRWRLPLSTLPAPQEPEGKNPDYRSVS
jgi:hypothetical protein